MEEFESRIELAKLVKNYRLKSGMTQLELSKTLGYGTSQFVSLFERGLSKVPLETLGQLTVILGIPEEKVRKILCNAYKAEITNRINAGRKLAKGAS